MLVFLRWSGGGGGMVCSTHEHTWPTYATRMHSQLEIVVVAVVFRRWNYRRCFHLAAGRAESSRREPTRFARGYSPFYIYFAPHMLLYDVPRRTHRGERGERFMRNLISAHVEECLCASVCVCVCSLVHVRVYACVRECNVAVLRAALCNKCDMTGGKHEVFKECTLRIALHIIMHTHSQRTCSAAYCTNNPCTDCTRMLELVALILSYEDFVSSCNISRQPVRNSQLVLSADWVCTNDDPPHTWCNIAYDVFFYRVCVNIAFDKMLLIAYNWLKWVHKHKCQTK